MVLKATLERIHTLNSYASSTPATDSRKVYVSILDRDCSYVPSPIAIGPYFLVVSDSGVATSLDAKIGVSNAAMGHLIVSAAQEYRCRNACLTELLSAAPLLRLIRRNRAAYCGNEKLLHTGCQQQRHSVDDAHVLTHLGIDFAARLQNASKNRSHLCIIARMFNLGELFLILRVEVPTADAPAHQSRLAP